MPFYIAWLWCNALQGRNQKYQQMNQLTASPFHTNWGNCTYHKSTIGSIFCDKKVWMGSIPIIICKTLPFPTIFTQFNTVWIFKAQRIHLMDHSTRSLFTADPRGKKVSAIDIFWLQAETQPTTYQVFQGVFPPPQFMVVPVKSIWYHMTFPSESNVMAPTPPRPSSRSLLLT